MMHVIKAAVAGAVEDRMVGYKCWLSGRSVPSLVFVLLTWYRWYNSFWSDTGPTAELPMAFIIQPWITIMKTSHSLMRSSVSALASPMLLCPVCLCILSVRQTGVILIVPHRDAENNSNVLFVFIWTISCADKTWLSLFLWHIIWCGARQQRRTHAIIFQFLVPFITNQSITILSPLHLFIKLTKPWELRNEFEAWLGVFQVSQSFKVVWENLIK